MFAEKGLARCGNISVASRAFPVHLLRPHFVFLHVFIFVPPLTLATRFSQVSSIAWYIVSASDISVIALRFLARRPRWARYRGASTASEPPSILLTLS